MQWQSEKQIKNNRSELIKHLRKNNTEMINLLKETIQTFYPVCDHPRELDQSELLEKINYLLNKQQNDN